MTNQCDNLAPNLLKKAVVLSDEMAWSASDALLVIEHLVGEGCAIAGVELWQKSDGQPKWVATSSNDCEMVSNWTDYVQCCADSATLFIKRFAQEPSGLFNLSWNQEKEQPGL